MTKPAVYPPPNQVLSALGIEVARSENGMAGRTLVSTELLGRDGAVPGMGALSPIVDLVAGSAAGLVSTGDWLVTSDLVLYERQPLSPGRVTVETEIVRAGKRSVIVGVEVGSEAEPGLGVTGSVAFSRIRREASPHVTTDPAPAGEWVRLGSGDLLGSPIEAACGLVVIEADGGAAVEVGRSPFVANSIGTLQGGVVALLADAAAAVTIGPGARTVDMQFRFLAQTGDGPARATGEIVRSDNSASMVKVTVVDQADGALVGLAVCRVQH